MRGLQQGSLVLLARGAWGGPGHGCQVMQSAARGGTQKANEIRWKRSAGSIHKISCRVRIVFSGQGAGGGRERGGRWGQRPPINVAKCPGRGRGEAARGRWATEKPAEKKNTAERQGDKNKEFRFNARAPSARRATQGRVRCMPSGVSTLGCWAAPPLRSLPAGSLQRGRHASRQCSRWCCSRQSCCRHILSTGSCCDRCSSDGWLRGGWLRQLGSRRWGLGCLLRC